MSSMFEPVELEQIITIITPVTKQGNSSEVFCFQLEPSTSPATTSVGLKPGCGYLPWDSSDIIIKFQKLDVALDETVRLVNEIAAMHLAHCTLRLVEIVPEVFGFGKIEHNDQAVGWMIQEFMPGELLESAWDELSLSSKKTLLEQMAQMYVALQKCDLTQTLGGFGGLRYDDTGDMVAGPIVFGFGGPYASLEDMYVGMFKKQLELADQCSVVKGWSGSKKGLRQSLEKFINEGLASALAVISNKTPTLIHGDFDLHNILFDKSSLTITALLDFEFAHIASPIDEYLYSFQSLNAILVGPYEKGDMRQLQQYLLTGIKPEKLPPNSRTLDWKVAVAWNEAIKAAGGIRPSNVEGAGVLADMKWFMESIRPPYFAMPRWLARRTPALIETERKNVETELEKRLDRLGYLGK